MNIIKETMKGTISYPEAVAVDVAKGTLGCKTIVFFAHPTRADFQQYASPLTASFTAIFEKCIATGNTKIAIPCMGAEYDESYDKEVVQIALTISQQFSRTNKDLHISFIGDNNRSINPLYLEQVSQSEGAFSYIDNFSIEQFDGDAIILPVTTNFQHCLDRIGSITKRVLATADANAKSAEEKERAAAAEKKRLEKEILEREKAENERMGKIKYLVKSARKAEDKVSEALKELLSLRENTTRFSLKGLSTVGLNNVPHYAKIISQYSKKAQEAAREVEDLCGDEKDPNLLPAQEAVKSVVQNVQQAEKFALQYFAAVREIHRAEDQARKIFYNAETVYNEGLKHLKPILLFAAKNDVDGIAKERAAVESHLKQLEEYARDIKNVAEEATSKAAEALEGEQKSQVASTINLRVSKYAKAVESRVQDLFVKHSAAACELENQKLQMKQKELEARDANRAEKERWKNLTRQATERQTPNRWAGMGDILATYNSLRDQFWNSEFGYSKGEVVRPYNQLRQVEAWKERTVTAALQPQPDIDIGNPVADLSDENL